MEVPRELVVSAIAATKFRTVDQAQDYTRKGLAVSLGNNTFAWDPDALGALNPSELQAICQDVSQ